ncbi:50S ribosomal protein L15 [candidate division WOR-3 bacterium JGI_Cruoil_03_51_56]|uniref:Large ribosomal subunit protein uL15 n=1 Tax=candidate division WOR-3 bacterium JGI_Cruoil_03_51_56 TaxID=1973747 RepID=A0A235BTW2_UNCW3|nr:MAG: 50S ribosomal protein L15 [candidate division WOR-3 bacterium JGI_Cruoil_03_51_56]
MKLGNLRPKPGARKRGKRVGCGPGSGHGKTSCRGHKGAGQHSASEFDARFEGGQMPFYRRIPKRGFNNPCRTEYAVVNVGRLAGLDTDRITLDLMQERHLVRKGMLVKVLGGGEVSRPLTVAAHAFTKSARGKIEQAGGKVEVIH